MSIASVKQPLMNGVAVVHRVSCTAIEPRHGRGGTARQHTRAIAEGAAAELVPTDGASARMSEDVMHDIADLIYKRILKGKGPYPRSSFSIWATLPSIESARAICHNANLP
jgi:hypothetical protein